MIIDEQFPNWNPHCYGASPMVVATAALFTCLLQAVTASRESSEDTMRVVEHEVEHSYVQDAQAGLSHMLDELKAFQKRIEDSLLHAEKGAFLLAGILCAIAMLVLVAGAMYFHWIGNYVPKYVKVTRKDGKEILEDHPTSATNGRLKSE